VKERIMSGFNALKTMKRHRKPIWNGYGKNRDGREKVFKDAELEALLHKDSCQTQEELAGSLGVIQQAISKRIKAMGMIQKQGNLMRYDLKPRDVERCLFAYEQLLERQR